jgi:hypothetical protein
MRRLFVAAAAAFSAAALVVLPGQASAAPDPLPGFDFSACPAPPANADPGTWRCEAFVSQGSLTIGDREIPLGEMRLTFSEGEVDGKYAQVFGELRTSGCGPMGPVADHPPGLPSGSGKNTFKQVSYVQFKAL